MSTFQVLLVTGTHGNEINAPWFMDQVDQYPQLLNTKGVRVARVIGNPSARKLGKRYLKRDLNRSFCSSLLENSEVLDSEVLRARELLSLFGVEGSNPCQIVLDFHSTTSSMGSCLVVYGRRALDLAFASLLQARLGIPIYLHEGDESQTGFLVESWPCGLVVEIGPAPQGLLLSQIVQQSRLIMQACIDEIAKVKSGVAVYPEQLVVHRHLGSIDFPRDSSDQVACCVHPQLQGKDWQPLQTGAPLFLEPDGKIVRFDGNNNTVPLFINEAAYLEKNIAMSFANRELWPFIREWELAMAKLVCS